MTRRTSRKRTSLRRNSRRRTSLHPNGTIRYSGDTTVRITYDDNSSAYKATVKSPDGSRRIVVRPAPADRLAVDSPAAFDSAAHAAISFAMDEGLDCQPDYKEDLSGYEIHRKPYPVRKNGHYRDPSTKAFRDLYASGKLRLGDAGSNATNREGMTWNEWRAAAGTGGLTTAKLLTAWRAGEDPTEYRALRRNSRRRASLRRNATGCPYCVSPPGRHKWWCKKLAKNSRKHTSRRR